MSKTILIKRARLVRTFNGNGKIYLVAKRPNLPFRKTNVESISLNSHSLKILISIVSCSEEDSKMMTHLK